MFFGFTKPVKHNATLLHLPSRVVKLKTTYVESQHITKKRKIAGAEQLVAERQIHNIIFRNIILEL